MRTRRSSARSQERRRSERPEVAGGRRRTRGRDRDFGAEIDRPFGEDGRRMGAARLGEGPGAPIRDRRPLEALRRIRELRASRL